MNDLNEKTQINTRLFLGYLLDKDSNQTYKVHSGDTVGRQNTTFCFEESPGMSREHFQIKVSAGVTTIEDLGSHNGTWVNNKKITSVPLKAGDKIQAGGTIFYFEENRSEFVDTLIRSSYVSLLLYPFQKRYYNRPQVIMIIFSFIVLLMILNDYMKISADLIRDFDQFPMIEYFSYLGFAWFGTSYISILFFNFFAEGFIRVIAKNRAIKLILNGVLIIPTLLVYFFSYFMIFYEGSRIESIEKLSYVHMVCYSQKDLHSPEKCMSLLNSIVSDPDYLFGEIGQKIYADNIRSLDQFIQSDDYSKYPEDIQLLRKIKDKLPKEYNAKNLANLEKLFRASSMTVWKLKRQHAEDLK